VGHFGGAWQNQKIDFAGFPGPVVITTNCVIEPLRAYRDRLYTLNETGVHGVKHIDLENPDHQTQLVNVRHHQNVPPDSVNIFKYLNLTLHVIHTVIRNK
jgi:hydroxylamine reductase (hybrid-cluster protein)